MKHLIVRIVIGALTVVIAGATTIWLMHGFTTYDATINKSVPPIDTVAFCDLIHSPDSYSSQIVRVQSTLIGYHELALYDPYCGSKEKFLQVDFDSASRKRLISEVETLNGSGFQRGNFWVSVVLVGRFEKLQKGERDNEAEESELINRQYTKQGFHLVVLNVEQVAEVTPDVLRPWRVEPSRFLFSSCGNRKRTSPRRSRAQLRSGINPSVEPYEVLLTEGVGLASPAEKHTKVFRYKDKTEISKEEAFSIAKTEALKSYESLEIFNVVACETARVWVIIYDGGGPEYVISKQSGLILGRKKIPQGPEAGVAEDVSSRKDGWVREEEAIEIAKQQAYADYGEAMSRYNIFACELAQSWNVGFEYRQVPGELLPNSRSPFYVIDKKTGKVIYKEG